MFKSYFSDTSKPQYLYSAITKTPQCESDLLYKLAESICSPGEPYGQEKFALEKEYIQFKSSTFFATVDTKDPHIHLLVERTTKGHRMFILYKPND